GDRRLPPAPLSLSKQIGIPGGRGYIEAGPEDSNPSRRSSMRALLTSVALLALGACSLPQAGRSRVFEPYAPLRATITTANTPGGPLFHVNRPAYVAMFYIVPGSGVSMLYPGFGSGSLDGRVFAGSHFGRSRLTRGEMYQYQFASR